jgi:hypothetical protein
MFHSFLKSVLDGGEWSVLPCPLVTSPDASRIVQDTVTEEELG